MLSRAVFVIVMGWFSVSSWAQTLTFAGSYLGELPFNTQNLNWVGKPAYSAMSAGKRYLEKQQINAPSFVSDAKQKLYTKAREEALALAETQNKTNYAVTHIRFDIIRSEQTTEVYADYYLIAW